MSLVRSAFAQSAPPSRHALRRQACRTRQRRSIAPVLDPFRLVAVASELLVELQGVEPVEPRLQRDLAVGFPEELRVAQARRDHTLGVLRDHAFVLRLRVDDREECFLQLPVVGHDREPMLMVNERRRQHLLRKLQERSVEETGNHAGELDQVRHFIDQCGVLGQLDAGTETAGVLFELPRDAVAAFRMCRARRSAPPAAPGTRRSCGP